jgi:hypothetical protein
MAASKAQILVKKITALFETLVAELGIDAPTSPSEPFRVLPGGPLNEHGVAEIHRLFAAGLSSSEIALKMDISLSGVAKRRGQWKRGNKGAPKPLKAAL